MADNIQLFDRALLAQRRLRALPSFSQHDFLLSHIGEDFRDRLGAILRDFPVAVDLGAQNGAAGQHLAECKQVGSVIQLESCFEMLEKPGALNVVADEEILPFRPLSVDLVFSALSLHFVNDLPGVLLQIRQCLKPDGLMLVSVPGGRSLYELRESFAVAESEILGGASPRVGPFVDIRDCGDLLQRAGFALPVVDSYDIDVTFASPLAVMNELRGMGAQNVLFDRLKKPLRRDVLFRMLEVYQDKYGLPDGRVSATFEVVTLTGWGPDESQQKPLRPGSAKARLADALGTTEIGLNNKNK